MRVRHGISDPGQFVIKSSIEHNITVIPIPGACAAINALVASGLDTTKFTFYGFLPLDKHSRNDLLEQLKYETKTAILYEAPHKIKNTLISLKNVVGNRKVVIARELTKIHEEILRDNIDDLILKADTLKGEMIILIEGASSASNENPLNKLSLDEHYKYYKDLGLDKKDIIKSIAKDRNVRKNEIYMNFIDKD